MTRWVKWVVTAMAILVLVGGVGYLAEKKYIQQKWNRFTARLSAGRVDYNVVPDCVTVEDPKYDVMYPPDPRDGCEPLKCARHALALSKHLTDDQIPISSDDRSAISKLDACLRQHPGGTALIIGHGAQGEIDTAFGGGYDWFLSNQNHQQWVCDMQAVQSKPSAITLWGCSTGKKPDGSILLHQIQSDVCASSLNACTTSIKAPMVPVFCDDAGLYFRNGENWNTVAGSPLTPDRCSQAVSSAGGSVQVQLQRPNHQASSDEYSADKFSQIFWEQNGTMFRKLDSFMDKSKFFSQIDFANKTETSGCPVARKMGMIELHPFQGEKRFFVMYSNGLVRDLSKTDVKVYYQGSDELVNNWNALQPH